MVKIKKTVASVSCNHCKKNVERRFFREGMTPGHQRFFHAKCPHCHEDVYIDRLTGKYI